VRPGDRLPLIPRHLVKAGFDWRLGSRSSVGVDLNASSDFYFRGDEGNDAVQIDGAVLLNVTGEIQLSDSLALFVKVDNLLDEDYETFGQYGEPGEVLGETFSDARFVSPGAPRAAWIGVRLRMID
jgi:iron complex outermembrane receptor protein